MSGDPPEPTEPIEPPMKIGEVASLLGVSTHTVHQYIYSGSLPAVRTPGGQWRVHGDALLAWMTKRT